MFCALLTLVTATAPSGQDERSHPLLARASRARKPLAEAVRSAPTVGDMMKAAVWLPKEERQILERLAPKFGGRQEALREALQRLAADEDRRESFDAFLQAWEEEDGPLSNEEIAAVAKRCGL